MREKKEKKPNVTGRKLIRSGYRYKMKELTREQKKEQREGRKEIDANGKVRTFDPPDYNYYYKVVNNVTVKIFKVGDKFFYRSSWFRYMENLPRIEQHAKDNEVYDKLEAQVVDTVPLPDTQVQNKALTGDDVIVLHGGPLNGERHSWKYPMFMRQYVDPDDGVVRSARYRRSKEDKSVYVFDMVIGG